MGKTIIVLVDEESEGYNDEEKVIYGDTKVITIPIGENADKVRGYYADVVMVPDDTEWDIMTRVIAPMAVGGSEIIKY